jgi:hypothetical protein
MPGGRARKGPGLSAETRYERLETEFVALRAEARNHADGDRGHVGELPEGLARVDIREVHLDHGQTRCHQGIPQCDARMRESAGIDQDAVGVADGLLDPIDELALMVRLDGLDFDTEVLGHRREIGIDIGQGLGPIDLGLAFSEQIQIGTVDDQDPQALGRIRRSCAAL